MGLGIGPGNFMQVYERFGVFRIVSDIAKQECFEVDLAASSQHERGCTLDAATVRATRESYGVLLPSMPFAPQQLWSERYSS